MSNEEQRHWYQFCVMFQTGMGATYKSIACGFTEPKVTNARMAFARRSLDAPSDALIVSISYLGQMTREEFEA